MAMVRLRRDDSLSLSACALEPELRFNVHIARVDSISVCGCAYRILNESRHRSFIYPDRVAVASTVFRWHRPRPLAFSQMRGARGSFRLSVRAFVAC